MEFFSLSKQSRYGRMTGLGILAFLNSLALGSHFLPTASYFWAVGLGRLLIALILLLLPGGAAAWRKGLLLVLGVTTLLLGWSGELSWVAALFLLLFYLTLELFIDGFIVDHATEQEVPLEFGVLSLVRLVGLWIGFVLQYGVGVVGFTSDQVVGGSLTLCLLYLALLKFEDKVEEVDRDNPSNLRLVSSCLNLLAVSFLAGSLAGTVLPFPLVHPNSAVAWLAGLLPSLKLLAIGLLAVWILESFTLSTQLLLSVLGLSLFLAGWYLEVPWIGEFSGVLLAVILIAGRAFLRESFRSNSLLRGAVLVTLWTLGCLIGVEFGGYPGIAFCGLMHAVFVAVCYSHYSKEPTHLESLPENVRSERFGDRIQDFEAAPASGMRKGKLKRSLRTLMNLLLVELPVTILLATVVSLTIVGGWQLLQKRGSLQKQVRTAGRVFQTRLFFTGFERRLTEELMATSEVPQDWALFLATSFNNEGKPMTDIDAWGTPYRFEESKKAVEIRSAGPDKRFETEDDLARIVKKPGPVDSR